MKLTLETRISKKTNSTYLAVFAHLRYKTVPIAFGDVALEMFDVSKDDIKDVDVNTVVKTAYLDLSD